MNRAQLVNAVYNRAGVSFTDGQLTPGVIGQFVNDANHQIEVMEDWPWLMTSATFSTASGVDTYAVPADWIRTDEILIQQAATGMNTPLNYHEGRDLDDRYPSNYSQFPQAWSIRGDLILLRPIPDGVYTVTHWYFRQEPDLIQDGDAPIMPTSFHSAIVEKAASLTLRRVQQEGRGAVAEQEFQQVWLPRMQAHRRRFAGPMKIRVRAGYMGP